MDDTEQMAPPTVTLVIDSGQSFPLFVRDAQLSTRLRRLIRRLNKTAGGPARNQQRRLAIEVPGVPAAALRRVCSYLEHRSGRPGPTIASPIRSTRLADLTPDKWDAEFADECWYRSRNDFYDLMRVALVLDIPCLMQLLCARMGCAIKGKPLHAMEHTLYAQRSALDALDEQVADEAVADEAVADEAVSSDDDDIRP